MLEDELIRKEASNDLDHLQILIDVSELGINGYQAADWLREHDRIDMGLSDHARIMATTSMADDASTDERLIRALRRLTEATGALPEPPPIKIPTPTARAGNGQPTARRPSRPPHTCEVFFFGEFEC